MEIKSINNTSFNGWKSSAKTVLVNMIKRMPKAKADKTTELVNHLEEISTHHDLYANSICFWAVPHKKFTKEKSFDLLLDPAKVFYRNPVKVLEELQEHIYADNARIQKAGKFIESIMPKFKKFDGGRAATSLDLSWKAKKIVATKLAQLAVSENGSAKAQQAFDMLNRINEKGRKVNLHIYPASYSDDMSIAGMNLRGGYSSKDIKIHDDFRKTLRKIEAFLDKEKIKNQKFKLKSDYKNAKEDLAEAKKEFINTKREIKAQQWEAFKESLADTSVGRFCRKVCDIVTAKSRAKEAEISKKLNF